MGVVVSLGFLGLGFQLSAVYGPDVTLPEFDSTNSSACLAFDSCGSCTRRKECGFCFVDDPAEGAILGACVPVREGVLTDESLYGRCSNMSSVQA